MGDGNLHRPSKEPAVRVKMISERYLNYLSENVFPLLSGNVRKDTKAEESAKHCRNTGFSPKAKPKNYSDLYSWRTMCHPGIQKYVKWYSSGSKVFPENIKLTPTTLKHWFISDGDFDQEKGRARIAAANERENQDKVSSLLRWAGFDDFGWSTYASQGNYGDAARIYFNKEGTKWFFRYIGNSLPGFEYKWPNNRSDLGLGR